MQSMWQSVVPLLAALTFVVKVQAAGLYGTNINDTVIPLTCHDNGVMLIAVVGSNVPNGSQSYGLGAGFVSTLMANIPNSDTISMNYNRFHAAADAGKTFVPEVTNAYPALQVMIQNYTTACPNTPIVLHGYSEGAVVVSNLLCGASSGSFVYPTAPLDSKYTKNIMSVVFYGDETRTAGQSYNLGTCVYDAPHLPRRNPSGCAAFAPTFQSYCFADDADCCSNANASNPNGPNGAPWHWDYPSYYDGVSVGTIINQYNAWSAAVNTVSSTTTSTTSKTSTTSTTTTATGTTATTLSTSTTATSTATSTAGALPSGISAVGCYSDSWTRTLPVSLYSNSSNSQSLCALACRAAGYTYSGTEYGQECYCGNGVASANAVNATDCNMACPGNSAQTCGAGWRLSVSQDTSTTTSSSSLPTGFTSLGCYADLGETGSRTFPYQAYKNSSNTPSMCAVACRQAGYVYSGTEYGQECWCGSTAPTTAADASSCNSACAGNSLLICGGGWRLTAAQDTVIAASPADFTYLGCYQDGYTRTLPVQIYSDWSNTNYRCELGCRAAGYKYSGTEYSNECWCGSTKPLVQSAGNCGMACSGNSSEVCGGGFALSVHSDTKYTGS